MKRGQYVLWQLELLKDYQIQQGEGEATHEAPPSPGPLEDLRTGYEDHAISSYQEFCRLREDGIIPKGVRFQVSLPTPLNVVACGVHSKYQVEVEPKYEAALLRALGRIQDAIRQKIWLYNGMLLSNSPFSKCLQKEIYHILNTGGF